MLHFSVGEIREYFESKVWLEIRRKIEQEIAVQDAAVENPEPYKHGLAVGARRQLRWFINDLPGIMERDARKRELPTGE